MLFCVVLYFSCKNLTVLECLYFIQRVCGLFVPPLVQLLRPNYPPPTVNVLPSQYLTSFCEREHEETLHGSSSNVGLHLSFTFKRKKSFLVHKTCQVSHVQPTCRVFYFLLRILDLNVLPSSYGVCGCNNTLGFPLQRLVG